MTVQERVYEETAKLVFAKPLRFSEFLERFGPKDYVELIDGSVVEKEMVQLDHEKLYHWLAHILRSVIREGNLGILLGSRTAVEIDEFRGRLPDLFFVRKERMDIVRQKGVFGAPDLVIEIISPGDRPSDQNALEVDYTRIGVPDIVFIDQKRRQVRTVCREEDTYETTILTSGPLRLDSLGGITLQVAWLFQDPLPDEKQIVNDLLKDV